MRKPDGWDKSALLSDRDVRTWFEGNLLRSKVSAETDLRKLGLITHRLGTTPGGTVSLARTDPDELGRRLVRYAGSLKKQGRLDTYVMKTFSGLKSWLRFKRVTFDQYPRLRAVQGLSLRTETVPTQEELGRILSALTLRGRAVALLMAHSGLRPGAISKDGIDGLRLRDLEDLDLSSQSPAFRKAPFTIRVPGSLSKTGREYITFGSQEEATALLAYFSHRANSGERLTPDSSVIAVAPHQAENWLRGSGRTNGFVTTETLTFELRTGIRKVVPPGTRWRPYVLRAYCSAHLLSAESAGKITRDVREAILGHDLGVSGRYNLSKKLHPEQIEEMRAAFRRAEPFLSTVTTKGESDAGVNKVLKALLSARGMPQEEVDKLELAEKSEEELKAIFGKFLSSAAARPAQKAVPISEVGGLLAQGWEFVSRLDDRQAVLREPSAAPAIR